MDRIKAVLICLPCILLGCTHRSNDFYHRTINYIIPLVDGGYIVDDYIHLYGLATNDSNSVYEISGMDSPFSRPEYPSKVNTFALRNWMSQNYLQSKCIS